LSVLDRRNLDFVKNDGNDHHNNQSGGHVEEISGLSATHIFQDATYQESDSDDDQNGSSDEYGDVPNNIENPPS